MALLFVDTTYDLTIGLLNDQFNWLEFRSQKGQKASVILQSEAFDICSRQGIKVKDLKGVITTAGPGFYTGLRLTEGFSDILKAFHIPCYSFYSYEIPLFLGSNEGVWLTKAYRGEYFFHEWNSGVSTNNLISVNELDTYLNRWTNIFIHSMGAIDRALPNAVQTIELLKQQPQLIFKEVVRSELQRESFYFRAPEDEFRVSQ